VWLAVAQIDPAQRTVVQVFFVLEAAQIFNGSEAHNHVKAAAVKKVSTHLKTHRARPMIQPFCPDFMNENVGGTIDLGDFGTHGRHFGSSFFALLKALNGIIERPNVSSTELQLVNVA
jgi:hypothetical protein